MFFNYGFNKQLSGWSSQKCLLLLKIFQIPKIDYIWLHYKSYHLILPVLRPFETLHHRLILISYLENWLFQVPDVKYFYIILSKCRKSVEFCIERIKFDTRDSFVCPVVIKKFILPIFASVTKDQIVFCSYYKLTSIVR